LNEWERINSILDGYMKEELLNIKEKYLSKRKDFVIVIDGIKGTGKSTCGLQACKFIDPSFNIDRVHFFEDSFSENLRTILPAQAIMMDEAIINIMRRNAMTNTNKKLVIAFNIIRKKAAFIVLCIPHIKNLDWAIQTEHVFSLIHVKDYTKRNDVQLWEWYSKRRLNQLIKEKYDYKRVTPNKYGWFRDFRPFEKEYELKKDRAITKFLSIEADPKEQAAKNKFDKTKIVVNLREKGFTQKEIAGVVSFTRERVSQILKDSVNVTDKVNI